MALLFVGLVVGWIGVRWGEARERHAWRDRVLGAYANGVAFGMDLSRRPSPPVEPWELFHVPASSDAEAASKLIALSKDRP